MMERTVHRGMTGVTLEKEVFTDLDFADDVSLLAEMFEVLVLSMTVMQEEASTFGLQINWSKTKIIYRFPLPPLAQQSRWQMDMLKWSMHLSIWNA